MLESTLSWCFEQRTTGLTFCGRKCVPRRTGTRFKDMTELIEAIAKNDPAVPRELELDFRGPGSKKAIRCLAHTADFALCPAQFVCCVSCGAVCCVPACCGMCALRRELVADPGLVGDPAMVCCLATTCSSVATTAVLASQGYLLNKLGGAFRSNTTVNRLSINGLAMDLDTCMLLPTAVSTILGHGDFGQARYAFHAFVRCLCEGSNNTLQHLEVKGVGFICEEDLVEVLHVASLQTLSVSSHRYGPTARNLNRGDLGKLMELILHGGCETLDEITLVDASRNPVEEWQSEALQRQVHANKRIRIAATDLRQGSRAPTEIWLANLWRLAKEHISRLGEALSHASGISFDFSGSSFVPGAVGQLAQLCREHRARIAGLRLHDCEWEPDETGAMAFIEICIYFPGALPREVLQGHNIIAEDTSHIHVDFSGSIFPSGAAGQLAQLCREHRARIAGMKLHDCEWELNESDPIALLELSAYFPEVFSKEELDGRQMVNLAKVLGASNFRGVHDQPWLVDCPGFQQALSKYTDRWVSLKAVGLIDQSIPLVVGALSQNPHVKVVDLSNNSLTDACVRALDNVITPSANAKIFLLDNSTFVGEPKLLLKELGTSERMDLETYLTPLNLRGVTQAWRALFAENPKWAHQQDLWKAVGNEAEVLHEITSPKITRLELIPNVLSNGVGLRTAIESNLATLSKVVVDLRVNCLDDLHVAELVAAFPELLANLAPQFLGNPEAVKIFSSAPEVGMRSLEAYLRRPGDFAVRSLLGETVPAILIHDIVRKKLVNPLARDMPAGRFEAVLKFVEGGCDHDDAAEGTPTMFDWQPVCDAGRTLDLSFAGMRDEDAARLADSLAAKRDRALHVILWGNALRHEGAMSLLDVMRSTQHNIDLRFNPLSEDLVLEVLAADPARYAYLQSTLEQAVLKERISAREASSQNELASRTCRALLQRPAEHDYLMLFALLDDEVQELAWEELGDSPADPHVDHAKRSFQAFNIAFKLSQYSFMSMLQDTILPTSDVIMDAVQGVLYFTERQWQFLSILGVGCGLNAVGTAHAAYKKGFKGLAVLNLATLGLGGLVYESLGSNKSGAKTEMLFVYKKFEAVESSLSWGTGCYSLLIAGFLPGYHELDLSHTCIKWFSLLLSLVTIPKLALDLSRREAARGQALSDVHAEASSTEGKFALFLFHSFDLGSILVLFPFALSTRPTGIFFFLLFKVLVIYTVAIVELQVPADDAAAQALSLLIMNPAKNDAKLAALSLKALVIRVASVLAAWLITAHQVYWKDELAHHFLQPGNACILIMAAVSLIGLVCCARYWAKRGFWAAATSALPSSAPAEQGKSAPTAKDDRLPQEDPLPQDPLLSPA